MTKNKRKIIIILLITAVLFVLSSYFSSAYEDKLREMRLFSGAGGIFLFLFLMMAAVVIAPFETLPLIPIAVSLWGPLAAALFSVIGWSAGSLIAFALARRYGEKIVCRFVAECDLDAWRTLVPARRLFWLVIAARFVLPVDIISYVVGLFTKMGMASYFIATVFGIIPFALIFSYGARLPLWLQAAAGALIVVFMFYYYQKGRRRFIGMFK